MLVLMGFQCIWNIHYLGFYYCMHIYSPLDVNKVVVDSFCCELKKEIMVVREPCLQIVKCSRSF